MTSIARPHHALVVDQNLHVPLGAHPIDNVLNQDLTVVRRPRRNEEAAARKRHVRNPVRDAGHGDNSSSTGALSTDSRSSGEAKY